MKRAIPYYAIYAVCAAFVWLFPETWLSSDATYYGTYAVMFGAAAVPFLLSMKGGAE